MRSRTVNPRSTARAGLAMLRAISPLAAAGLVAAVLSGGYGIAAAATGSVFILGHSNSESSLASLSNSHGTPLSLHAPSGVAPLKVNTTTQVKNLNASLLGGLSASAFDQGGSQSRAYGFTLSSYQVNAPLLNIPGLGQLQASCAPAADSATVQLALALSSTAMVDEFATYTTSSGMVDFFSGTEAGSSTLGLEDPAGPGKAEWNQLVLRYTTGSGTDITTHIATVDVLIAVTTAGACDYDASASTGRGTAP
jgi:hypothetical protein